MSDRTRPDALRHALATLASTPDDASEVPACFKRIVTAVAIHVAVVDYAAISAGQGDTATTVALSNDVVLDVDEAQYLDDRGPCLQARDTSRPVAADDIALTVKWPKFREEAVRLGLRSSLSIPLWAARGRAVAALNLYARHPHALSALSTAVDVAFDDPSSVHSLPEMTTLDHGSTQLINGLIDAMTIQREIHIGIGIISIRHGTTPDAAYLILREQADAHGQSLPDAVKAL